MKKALLALIAASLIFVPSASAFQYPAAPTLSASGHTLHWTQFDDHSQYLIRENTTNKFYVGNVLEFELPPSHGTVTYQVKSQHRATNFPEDRSGYTSRWSNVITINWEPFSEVNTLLVPF